MVINYCGEKCFKIQSGKLGIVSDPLPRFKGNIVLFTQPIDLEKMAWPPTANQISGPGEYEIKGVNISGYNSKWLALSNYKNKCTGVGFGMAASQSNKRWTTAKWTALTHQVIKDLNQRVVLFSGKSEDELKEASHILHNIGREKCELMNILFLKDVALHMGEICCFVSNDTGLLHMASAMNIPTIGLYISTDSDIWSPHDKINFIAVQNNLTKKCPNPKPHCGNCFHYYDVCPAIIKYGDNIEPSRIFDEIKRIIF